MGMVRSSSGTKLAVRRRHAIAVHVPMATIQKVPVQLLVSPYSSAKTEH
jgi:hypothetical protein